MGRTRLFHTLVVVGSGMLASCSGSSKHGVTAVGNTASPDAAAAPPPPAQIDAGSQIREPPPPPRIHAVTPEKMGGGPP